MLLQPIIGLETHIQLKTKSKMFCGCSNDSDAEPPNTNVCPICLAHPGVLPVPNEQAIRFAILLSLALKGKVAPESKFDRKNYFYPDLPKAYQISQYDLPIMTGGELTLEVPGEKEPVVIEIERLHLEEDAAKNIHGEDGKTYVDFNRSGTPLCEIVTRPDFRTSAQAKAYLQELRLLARTLGVSDADMEKGHLRCDVNISLRELDEKGYPISSTLNPKTEIKNVNSFRAVERAIEYEIKRQTKLWEAGTPPERTTTRGWNDETQSTEEQRGKEDAADYRYFPEPDIPPMRLAELADEMRAVMPELPSAKRLRFVEEYGFRPSDARMLIDDPSLADFTEYAMAELTEWLASKPDLDEEAALEERKKLARIFSSWLLNKLMGLLVAQKSDVRTMHISPENFAEFITMIADGKLTGPKGLEVLEHMLEDGDDPSHAVEELGASRLDDVTALGSMVDAVLEAHPEEVKRYKNGDAKLMTFFVGQVMKESRGNADPELTARILSEKL